MQNFQLRKTNRFTCESLNPGSEIQILALNFLGITITDLMLVAVKMTLISAPIIGVITANPQRFQQGFQRFEHLILALAKHKRQHDVSGVIHRISQPTLIELVANIGPLLIHFSLAPSQFHSHRSIVIRI
jgi:hypothetical protein